MIAYKDYKVYLQLGLPGLFQAYTYGLCGPLALPPKEAVLVDTSYNGGFMIGRILSIFVAKLVI